MTTTDYSEITNRVINALNLVRKEDEELKACYGTLFGYEGDFTFYEDCSGKRYSIGNNDERFDDIHISTGHVLVSVNLGYRKPVHTLYYDSSRSDENKAVAEHLLRVLMTAAEMTDDEIEAAVKNSNWEDLAEK